MCIRDRAYTLPLLLGVLGALALARRSAALRINAAGLVLSTAYLGWSALAQAHVEGLARESLAAQGLPADRLLVGPTPFNTLLWRVVAVDEAGSAFREGFYSLLDAPATPARRIHFDRFERGNALAAELAGHPGVRRIQAFSDGLWAMAEQDGRIRITDLRMGQEPTYSFSFAVAARHLSLIHIFGETDDMAFWIQDIRDELGVTVLMVEHDMRLVSKVSDRVLAMNQGEVLALGPPAEVQGHPGVIEAYLGSTQDLASLRRVKTA